MKSEPTTKAEKELRQIRDAIHDEAMAVGWDKYYADLNKRAGFFFGAFPKRKPFRQRRTISATLPEPNAVKEVHAWRRKIQRATEKVGCEKYLADLNQRPSLLGRQHNRSTAVVREKPATKYKAR